MKSTLAVLLLSNLLSGSAMAMPGSADVQEYGAKDHHDWKYKNNVIRVKAGHSIQQAINHARGGTIIKVDPGTYREQLIIKKDGITIYGNGATLETPEHFVHNACSGVAGTNTQVGICVAGSGIKLDKFVSEHQNVRSVARPVYGVTVDGFTVKGFNGANIMVLGGKKVKVTNNNAIDGAQYGILSSGSRHSYIAGNIVTSSDPAKPGIIAICTDDKSASRQTHNTITFYAIGLCMQTDYAELDNNDVSYTCAAGFLDPGVDSVHFHHNKLHDSYEQCNGFGPYGLVFDGAKNANVEYNSFTKIHGVGDTARAINMVDEKCVQGAPNVPSLSCPVAGLVYKSTGNYVHDNYFSENDIDIVNESEGKRNKFKRNQCSTSTPPGICEAT